MKKTYRINIEYSDGSVIEKDVTKKQYQRLIQMNLFDSINEIKIKSIKQT